MKKLIVAAMLGGLCLTVGACAEGARPDAMTFTAATPLATGEAGYKTLTVGTVTGGGETNPLWMSGVSPDDFKAALEASLRSSGYMADSNGSVVSAQLLNLDRPLAGIDMTVTSQVKYQVTPPASSTPSFSDTVSAAGTAKFGDSLLAVERLRLANQNSIKANIAEFLKRYQASLKK